MEKLGGGLRRRQQQAGSYRKRFWQLLIMFFLAFDSISFGSIVGNNHPFQPERSSKNRRRWDGPDRREIQSEKRKYRERIFGMPERYAYTMPLRRLDLRDKSNLFEAQRFPLLYFPKKLIQLWPTSSKCALSSTLCRQISE
ncbi:hypothetical protein LJR231_002160 [Phyllobacterium sp. LjRoot231]|uniref:hypothetical protein n=1 Tax=Phyllobacterium sp. LjRoot231 TaxID=3342289 RepID=UPI003ECD9AE0